MSSAAGGGDDSRTSTRAGSSPAQTTAAAARAAAVEKVRSAARQVKVLYLHGLESGPKGAKVQVLRGEGFAVLAPDMNPAIAKLKSVTRNPWLTAAALTGALDVGLLLWLLRARRFALAALAAGAGALAVLQLFRRAVRLVVDECMAVQRRAIASFDPDVIVGSSWGGAIAVYLILRRQWRGPTLLLAPAQTAVHAYARYSDLPRRLTLDGGDERVRRNSASAPASAVPPFPLHVIHGRGDTRIPLHHSERVFGRLPYAVLERVDDGHNLMTHCTDAVFRDRIERLHALGLAAKAGVSAAALAYAATSAPEADANASASASASANANAGANPTAVATAAAAAASAPAANATDRARAPSPTPSAAAAVRSADAPLTASWVLVSGQSAVSASAAAAVAPDASKPSLT